MGILAFLGLRWKPRENMTYRYKRWHRRKNLIWRPSTQQGNPDPVPEGTRSQNLSKVYVIIDGKAHLGTFKVSKDSVVLGLVKHKKVYKLYKTGKDNVKFSKRYKGETRVYPSYGKTMNITKHYRYTAEVLDSSKLADKRTHNQIVRRRGTVLVDTLKGILIASHNKTWLLPGGGANQGESREKAAIRELREETGLRATNCKYLFEYDEPDDGRKIRNLHKVFLIEAEGKPKPNHYDVHHFAFWKPDSNIKLSPTTKRIVDRYITEFKNK
jgi:8-oxo-dGTP pyrophosphatase MutT (NUDIX family)